MACGHMLPSLDWDEQCCCEWQVFVGTYIFISLGYIPGSEISGSFRNRQRFPKWLHPTPNGWGFQLLHFLAKSGYGASFSFLWFQESRLSGGISTTSDMQIKRLLMKVTEWWVIVAQSCLTLCDPLDHSPPDSSVHGILQARILE